MTVICQRMSGLLRGFLLMALLVQSITGTGMIFKMALARAAPASAETIVICTSSGTRNVAWSDLDGETPQKQHSCLCAGGILCGRGNAVFFQSEFSPVSYPRIRHSVAVVWHTVDHLPSPFHDYYTAHPRAPPVHFDT